MKKESLALHLHTYVISLDTYNKHQNFKDNAIITQTDTMTHGNRTTFINALEDKHYPFFSFMYHPEYQSMEFVGDSKWAVWNDEVTDEIAFRISLKLN